MLSIEVLRLTCISLKQQSVSILYTSNPYCLLGGLDRPHPGKSIPINVYSFKLKALGPSNCGLKSFLAMPLNEEPNDQMI